jgi:hypothetical protein
MKAGKWDCAADTYCPFCDEYLEACRNCKEMFCYDCDGGICPDCGEGM